MSEGFNRFKRKYFLEALLKSVLTGVSIALLVIATFLLVIKLGEIDFELLFGVLIGVAVGLLTGLVLFFILHLDDAEVAKRLDKELALKEKVQTMYAFRDDGGILSQLQREDAGNIIDSKPVNMSSLVKRLIPFIVVAVVSLAYCVSAAIVYFGNDSVVIDPPASTQSSVQNEDEDTSDPFEATDHHKIALEALIKEVEKSNLQQDAKVAVIAELTILLAKLDEFSTDAQMKEYVIGVIKNVRAIVNTVNTTFAFHMYARENGGESLKKMSTALYSFNLNLIQSELLAVRTSVFESGTREGIKQRQKIIS